MNAAELPDIHGLVRLQHTGFDGTADFDTPYTLEDLADYHLKTILSQVSATDEILVIGMSMGGMVASVLGSKLRNHLPAKTRFRFLVTSANPPELPCITKSMLTQWYKARPGDPASFAEILTPFVGKAFRASHPDFTQNYFEYRATGKNGQSSKSFIKQLTAVTSFDGTAYFAGLNADEIEFIHGGSDEIMSTPHHEVLRQLQPRASHHIVPSMGHMANFEASYLFEKVR